MKQSKQIIIDGVELIKSGNTNGRNWSMYRMKDENGMEYTTFDAKYINMLGNQITIEYEEKSVSGKKEGQVFTNRTIIEPKAKPETINALRAGAGLPPKEVGVMMPNDIQSLHQKVDEILKMVKSIYDSQQPPF